MSRDQRQRTGNATPQGNATIHIERLVIDGLPMDAAQSRQLQSALIQELESLVRRHGLHVETQGGMQAHCRAPNLNWHTSQPSHLLGQRIAQSIYRTLEPRS